MNVVDDIAASEGRCASDALAGWGEAWELWERIELWWLAWLSRWSGRAEHWHGDWVKAESALPGLAHGSPWLGYIQVAPHLSACERRAWAREAALMLQWMRGRASRVQREVCRALPGARCVAAQWRRHAVRYRTSCRSFPVCLPMTEGRKPRARRDADPPRSGLFNTTPKTCSCEHYGGVGRWPVPA